MFLESLTKNSGKNFLTEILILLSYSSLPNKQHSTLIIIFQNLSTVYLLSSGRLFTFGLFPHVVSLIRSIVYSEVQSVFSLLENYSFRSVLWIHYVHRKCLWAKKYCIYCSIFQEITQLPHLLLTNILPLQLVQSTHYTIIITT